MEKIKGEEKNKIEEARVENWKEVRELYLELLKNDPEAFADDYDEIAGRTKEEWVKTFEKNGAIFVSYDDGKPVGTGRVAFYDELPGTPVLSKLGVLPEYRGKGIATCLVKAREKWAADRGAKRVRLYVFADREKTKLFSEKNGYSVTEIQKDGFQRKNDSSVDVLIMEKELPGIE